MKKLVIALTALAAFTGRPRRPIWAPAPAPRLRRHVRRSSWTGFYIFGGGGYGIWSANGGVDNSDRRSARIAPALRTGGWLAARSVLAMISSLAAVGGRRLRRRHVRRSQGATSADAACSTCVGTTKMETAWAAGARVGYLVARTFLLRQRRLHRDLLDGQHLADSFTGTPSGFTPTASIPAAGSSAAVSRTSSNSSESTAPGLVHEDRISCGLAMTARIFRISEPLAPRRRPASTSPSSPSCRPSARRWSTASTGSRRSDRWPSTDLC